jgi:hypothetical protein
VGLEASEGTSGPPRGLKHGLEQKGSPKYLRGCRFQSDLTLTLRVSGHFESGTPLGILETLFFSGQAMFQTPGRALDALRSLKPPPLLPACLSGGPFSLVRPLPLLALKTKILKPPLQGGLEIDQSLSTRSHLQNNQGGPISK